MLAGEKLFRFLLRQKSDLLKKSSNSKLPPIIIEAQGYSNGRKITQFLETINKALHINECNYNNSPIISDIINNDQLGIGAKTKLLVKEIENELQILNMQKDKIDIMLRNLDRIN